MQSQNDDRDGAPNGASDGAVPDGGTPPVLADRGLVVRYYINEAASGQDLLLKVMDSADTPVNLTLNYYSNLSYAEANGHRGLRWLARESDGRASAPIDGTKIKDRLHGSTTATIEVVADVEAASGYDSRLTHIGQDLERGRFSLTCDDNGRFILRWNNDDNIGEWQYNVPTGGRVVLHAVVDTTRANENERVRLYAGGQEVARTGGSPPSLDDALDLSLQRYYVIGNREADNAAENDRSIKGTIFYAAMYSAALDAAEVAGNAALLFANDDGP